MEFLWITLIVFLILVGVSVLIGGIVYLIQRLRSGAGLVLPMRFLLRLYLYVVTISGLLLLAQGGAGLLQVAFASGLGNDFSYHPLHVRIDHIDPPKHPLQLKDPTQLTEEEREELSTIDYEYRQAIQEQRKKNEEEGREKGLERAFEEGLIQGISFTLIGGVIWGAHLFARRKLESDEDRQGPMNRAYLIIMVIIFGLVTIINLPQAVFEGFRYFLLEPVNEFGREGPPGGKLALSIVTLPIWIVYLVGAISSARGSEAGP